MPPEKFFLDDVVGVTGVEPVMRESKSRALPLGDTPLYEWTQIAQKAFTALSAYGIAVPRWVSTTIFCWIHIHCIADYSLNRLPGLLVFSVGFEPTIL